MYLGSRYNGGLVGELFKYNGNGMWLIVWTEESIPRQWRLVSSKPAEECNSAHKYGSVHVYQVAVCTGTSS